ncbi:MAG: hypothetical protein ACLFTU_04290, partial [Puniceicoccaceae bacterium]
MKKVFLTILLTVSGLSASFSQSVNYVLSVFGPIEDGGTSTDIISGGVITLGYFDNATSVALFNGAWVPLVGGLSANPTKGTVSFDSGGSAFTEPFQWQFTDSDSIPSPGQILSFRIDAPSGYFDVVSDDSWVWADPASPAPVTPLLDESGTWQGGDPGTVSLVPEPASYAILA